MARSCPQLSSLNLSECDQVTDAGVSSVAHNVPRRRGHRQARARHAWAPRQPNEARWAGAVQWLMATIQFMPKKPTIVFGEGAYPRDGVLCMFICAFNDYAIRAILRYMCHCAVHQQYLFRQFFGDINILNNVKSMWGAGLVIFKEGLSDMEWAEYDWRQDVIFRDTWRALPLPRAHSMSLRSDRNHSSVCCADYSHADRPDYYVSERDYLKLFI